MVDFRILHRCGYKPHLQGPGGNKSKCPIKCIELAFMMSAICQRSQVDDGAFHLKSLLCLLLG